MEMGILKLIIARLKSKSPAMYANLTKIAGIVVVLTGGFIVIYNAGIIPAHYAVLAGKIDNICVVVGAAATSLGLVSATTTSDPDLIHPEVKQNIIDQAISKGDVTVRGNDQN
jgi:hypothetical protein